MPLMPALGRQTELSKPGLRSKSHQDCLKNKKEKQTGLIIRELYLRKALQIPIYWTQSEDQVHVVVVFQPSARRHEPVSLV